MSQLIPDDLRTHLLRNGDDPEADHVPVLKLFNPTGAATWFLTEMLPHEPDFCLGCATSAWAVPNWATSALPRSKA